MRIDAMIRSSRRTLALEIDSQARLIVRAPHRMAPEKITGFIRAKQDWIARRQALALRRLRAIPRHRFEAGEKFLYLGREYPLELVDRSATPLSFCDGFRLIKYYRSCARGIFTRWYQQEAAGYMTSRAGVLSRFTGLPFHKIRITSGTSTWGKCTGENTLCFSWRLVMAPPIVVDYVIIHELAHTRIKNHSRAYWSLVSRLMPDYRLCRIWFREHGHCLVW